MSDGAAPAAGGHGGAPAGSGAPDAGASGSAAAPAQGGNNSDWTSGLKINDEARGWILNKGYKGPEDVIDAYKSYEKLQGVPKERLLRLPDKEDSPEWGDVWSKLGRPAEAKDYQFDMPKDNPDPGMADWAKKVMHELNIPRKQAEALVQKWNERNGGIAAENQKTQQQQMDAQMQGLKKEWGAAHDQNIELAKRAANTFGFDGKAIDKLESALGYDGVMKFLHSLQSKVGEDNFVNGSKNNSSFGGALTPSQAQSRIKALQADPDFTKRYVEGQIGPKEEMEKLHRMAFPDLE